MDGVMKEIEMKKWEEEAERRKEKFGVDTGKVV